MILRLDDCEYKKFKDNLNKTGMKQREYIFNLVTQQPIFQIHELDEVEEQIRKIGVNINQIAKRANCSDEVLQDDLKLIMKEQIKEMVHMIIQKEHKLLMMYILNVFI